MTMSRECRPPPFLSKCDRDALRGLIHKRLFNRVLPAFELLTVCYINTLFVGLDMLLAMIGEAVANMNGLLYRVP